MRKSEFVAKTRSFDHSIILKKSKCQKTIECKFINNKLKCPALPVFFFVKIELLKKKIDLKKNVDFLAYCYLSGYPRVSSKNVSPFGPAVWQASADIDIEAKSLII